MPSPAFSLNRLIAHVSTALWLPWALFAIALIATGFIYWQSVRESHERAQLVFNAEVSEIRADLKARLLAHTQLLRGAAALFAASDKVTRADWRAYIAGLQLTKNFPALQAVAFARVVTDADRENFVQEIRQSGLPDFAVRPAGRRAFYVINAYVEPFTPDSSKALGFDLWSDKDRRQIMEQARSTGEPTITRKTVLKIDQASKPVPAFIMFLPVFGRSSPDVLGYVLSPFRMPELMGDLLSTKGANISVSIHDGDDALADQLLFSNHLASGDQTPLFSSRETFAIGGQVWILNYSSRSNTQRHQLDREPIKLLLGGVLASCLLFALIRTLVVAQRNAIQSVGTISATLAELQAAQTQLVEAEKMAALGQLVANVAHEINTPISAIKSSGMTITNQLDHIFSDLLRVLLLLTQGEQSVFLQLIGQATRTQRLLTTREERALCRDAAAALTQANIANTHALADVLVQLHAYPGFDEYLPLLRHRECAFIFETAASVATVIHNAQNINMAVDRVSKIVFALKVFSRADLIGEMQAVQLSEGLDTVLTIYQGQIKDGVELVRDYQTVPQVHCLPDELHQVWTNLVHNALQAMNNKGTLSLQIRQEADMAVISITDTGCGIAPDVLPRIFEPFFTTKPIGQGSGLGLGIVKKIIDKHRGRIAVSSQVGVGTTFSVFVPIKRQPQTPKLV